MNRHHSIVSQIVDKIPPQERKGLFITRKLMERTEEQLRVLGTKIAVGRLGKGDTLEARAAIILEYVVRQKTSNRFSLGVLAAVLGMKKDKFQTLHDKVGNFLPSLSEPATPTPTKKRKEATPITTTAGAPPRKLLKSSSSQKGKPPFSRGVAKTTTRAVVRSEIPSSIPAMAIRLGPLVPDSHGFATQAEQLLRDIKAFMNTKNYSNPHHRREALNDLHRHRGVYEAACFYVVVTRATTIAKKGRRAASKDENVDNLADEVELDAKDVIHASNVSERTFTDILPIVTDLAAKISRSKKDPPPKQKITSSNGKSSRSNSTNRAKETVEAPTFVYSQTFLKWKEQVLSQACDEAKQEISKETGTPIDDITTSQAMQCAADAVLRRRLLINSGSS